MKSFLLPILICLGVNLMAQNQTINGVLTVKNSSSNTLRLEDDTPGQEALLRFRAKPANNSGWMHADIGVKSTSSGYDVGFLGFKIPANNTPNQGYKMVINSAGRVGIGTTSPNYPLHISGDGGSLDPLATLYLNSTANHGGIVMNTQTSKQSHLRFSENGNLQWQFRVPNHQSEDIRLYSWGTNTDIMTWQYNTGNVGIGTTNPNAKVTLEGDGSTVGSASINLKHSGNGMSIGLSTTNNNLVIGNSWNPESGTYLTITDGTGNVGIGTTNPQSKLAVEGEIRATKVKVLEDISVPDYVFEPDYDLRTLKETKEYIAENRHLPEIPSASEIGENGIDLGDMNMRLLKKIEELTLYQIELLERIEKLEKKVE